MYESRDLRIEKGLGIPREISFLPVKGRLRWLWDWKDCPKKKKKH